MTSTVIKAGQNFKLVSQLTTIDLADHLAEAHKVVAEARAQARAIVTKAKHDIAIALQAAKEKGYADGHASGCAEGFQAGQAQGLTEAKNRFDREHAALGKTLEGIVTQLDARKVDLLIEARHDVLEFSVRLGQRVAKRIGELDRSAATANLEEALRLVSSKTDVAVCVNPADAETMRRFAEGLVKKVQSCEHIRVIEDESVAPGGCTVATGVTEIDAGIDTQMGEIVRLLLGEPQG
ncbi:MAG: hypothetical protein KAV82_04320 [Phycisphaerae bacterium]|nr:hypothetical protein [Phycisphaerae bacterium]